MIYAILKELEENNSRNFKIELLTKHKDNLMLRKVCQLALDPFTNFYQRKIPEYVTYEVPMTLDWGIGRLKHLSDRMVTGHYAIYHLRDILSAMTADDAEVIKRIIGKDLKCGVSTSTVNKVWKGLVSEYPVLLCNKFNEKTESKIKYPALCQTKMDSSRINFEFNEGVVVSVTTRNGQSIDITPFLSIVLSNKEHFILDGELMYSLEGVDVDRKTASGIINKAIKGTISAEESKGLNLVCWDMIPYEYFIQGECPIKYLDRFLQLRLTISDSTSQIKIVDSKTVLCKEDAIQQYKNNLEKGLEGCILKNMDAIWSSKRSNDYLKLKNESSVDLLVVGFEYGSKGSQFENMLGALICETSDGLLQVNVGSGFKHTLGERDNPESYVGKIVEVKYNEVISNKTSDKKSLFLPIYVCVRSDKDVANSLEQLM